jgi:hypothetical protein
MSFSTGTEQQGMHRRDVLRAAGAITAGGLAGCGGAGVDDGDGSDPTDAAASTTEAGRTTAESGSDTGDATTTRAGTAETPTPPSMGTPELTARGSDCLSGEAGAAVTFGEGEVTVEGTIAAPNPCHRPELAASDYDEGTGELSLTVAAVEDTGDGQVCAACVGGIEYTVTVPFEHSLPGRVTVTHDGIETTTVAEASRGE